jgi:hypothetical protein
VPVLSKMNLAHSFLPCLFKIYFNIILSSTLGIQIVLFPSGFAAKILYAFIISPMRATYPALLVLLDLMIIIIFGE